MMLRFTLNQPEAADRIESAVQGVLAPGCAPATSGAKARSKVGTREMGDAVVARHHRQNHYQELAAPDRLAPPLDPGERAGKPGVRDFLKGNSDEARL
jgi:hypothetical protein